MTKRELEVEALLYGKGSLKQIGDILGISLSTVKAHCQKIYEFNGVQDRIELMSMKIDSLNSDLEMQYELQAGADW